MDIALFITQLLTILLMLVLSYGFLMAFGAPRSTLLFSRQEKAEWDRTIGRRVGSWYTVTNIVGSLTSLATVYIFFVGNSKVFGIWILACVVSLSLGALVTNHFTKRICAEPRVRGFLDSPDQVGGVIASLFWKAGDSAARQTSILVKYISLLNIFGVIWLEFSVFTDISARLLSITSTEARLPILAACSFAIIYYTLRFGIRGFVFLDLFQSPLILLGSLLLLGGSAIAIATAQPPIAITPSLLLPIASPLTCGIFAAHVLALNLFIVLVTEPHWLRVWAFREKEIRLQVPSILTTGAVTTLLIVLGFMAFLLSGGRVGEDAIVALLGKVAKVSLVFPSAFWIAAIAALFSTADAALYSFLVVRQFDTKSGELSQRAMASIRPAKLSLVATGLIALLYYLVRLTGWPFEKIIFVILPLSLTLLPAFARASRRLPQHPGWIIASMVFFLALSIWGLQSPPDQLNLNLCAALAPIIVAVVASFVGKPEQEKPADGS